MFHKVEDQEKHPECYVLSKVDQSLTDDECHNFLAKPRQTQTSIALYLKKIKGK